MRKTELRTIVAEIEGLGLGLEEGRLESFRKVIRTEVQHLHVNPLRLLHIEMSLTAVQATPRAPVVEPGRSIEIESHGRRTLKVDSDSDNNLF